MRDAAGAGTAQALTFPNTTVIAGGDTVLITIDRGDGAPLPNPIRSNTGPGATRGMGYFEVNIGAVSGTAPVATPRVEISDDSANWRILCYAMDGLADGISTAAIAHLSTVHRKRFERLVLNLAGTSPSFAVDASFQPTWAT